MGISGDKLKNMQMKEHGHAYETVDKVRLYD